MIQKMKGTYDVTSAIGYYQAIEQAIRKVSRLYNVEEIRTPHFESRELFHRSVGSDSDIVNKETYDFEDRGGRINTLRPEGTAGIVRAYIENKLHADPRVPLKRYYIGSMFRYERPQKGRFREFRQFGAEYFGSPHPAVDAELIDYALNVLRALKLRDARVHLNSLGGKASKEAYSKALKAHLKPHLETLCDDCKARYETNPLRILDCKKDSDKDAIKTAPRTIDYLTDADRDHFEAVKTYLDAMSVPYTVDDGLVRGLDYYTHTVFEVKVSEALLGKQNAICGGGRYNTLVSDLGGPDTPASGFAFGIERLIVAMQANGFTPKTPPLHVYFIVLGEKARRVAMPLIKRLRTGGISADMDYMERSMKAQFKQSTHHKARYVAIIGESEVEAGVVNLKDQREGQEWSVRNEDLYITLMDRLTSKTQDTCVDCKERGE
ncbi:MAG: histidine--tRNA ligase [Candidatus Izemoplasmataceae bacterium]